MLKSVFFRRLVIMLSVAMLIAAAVMLGGYVFLSKDVYADIKLDELHPSLDAAEQLAKEYMAGEIETCLNGWLQSCCRPIPARCFILTRKETRFFMWTACLIRMLRARKNCCMSR